MAQPNSLLELITQLAQRSTQSAASVAAAENANAEQGKAAVKGIQETTEKIGANQQIITSAALTAEMQTQNATADAITNAGVTESLYDTITQLRVRQDSLKQNLNEIRAVEADHSGLNPIDLISRAIKTIQPRRAAITDVEQIQQLNMGAQQLAQSVGAAATVAKATTKTITQAAIQAETDNIALTAQAQQYAQQLEGLKWNSVGVRAVAEAHDKELANNLGVANFARSEEQFQLSLREEERRAAQFDFQQEQARATREEKQDARQFEDRTIQLINLGEASRGLSPSSAQEIRDAIKLNKGLSAEYAELYAAGKRTAQTGQPSIATSPARASEILASNPVIPQNLPEEQRKVAEILLEARQVLNLPSNKIQLAGDKTGQVAAQLVNNQVQGVIRNQLSYVGNNSDNPFYLGDLGSYIGKPGAPGVASFQKYPLVQKVFNLELQAGVSLQDPTFVFKLAAGAAAKGEITSRQAAADLSNIYKRASAIHRAAMDFRKFGISLPEDGATYRVKINGEVIDVTDFPSVSRAMAKELRTQMLQRAKQELGPGSPVFAPFNPNLP